MSIKPNYMDDEGVAPRLNYFGKFSFSQRCGVGGVSRWDNIGDVSEGIFLG